MLVTYDDLEQEMNLRKRYDEVLDKHEEERAKRVSRLVVELRTSYDLPEELDALLESI